MRLALLGYNEHHEQLKARCVCVEPDNGKGRHTIPVRCAALWLCVMTVMSHTPGLFTLVTVENPFKLFHPPLD